MKMLTRKSRKSKRVKSSFRKSKSSGKKMKFASMQGASYTGSHRVRKPKKI